MTLHVSSKDEHVIFLHIKLIKIRNVFQKGFWEGLSWDKIHEDEPWTFWELNFFETMNLVFSIISTISLFKHLDSLQKPQDTWNFQIAEKFCDHFCYCIDFSFKKIYFLLIFYEVGEFLRKQKHLSKFHKFVKHNLFSSFFFQKLKLNHLITWSSLEKIQLV